MSTVIEKKELKRKSSSNITYGVDDITFHYIDLLGKEQSIVIKRAEIIDALGRSFDRWRGKNAGL